MNKKEKLVSIVIVSWNGKTLLEECLETLSKIDYKNLEIIVVDNGSVDGTQEFLKKQYKSIRLIENNKNLGFAEANNIGIKAAKGDAILLLNNDATMATNALQLMMDEAVADQSCGIVCPKIYFTKDRVCIGNDG